MTTAKKPVCKATTKAGKPCKASPLKGSDRCLAHDEKAREKARFSGAQKGAGRPARPRLIDTLREKIENDVNQILTPLFTALHATKESGAPDWPTRIAAARELMDRGYGKATQAIEHTGNINHDVGVAIPEGATSKDLTAVADELAERRGRRAAA